MIISKPLVEISKSTVEQTSKKALFSKPLIKPHFHYPQHIIT